MQWSDLYRFSNGKLLISSTGRPEYLYGAIREVEHRRYAVGYMTILIDNNDERKY
jgi:hypothetical protein